MKIYIEKVAHSSIVGSSLMVKDGPAGRCIAVLQIANAGDKAEEIAEAIAALGKNNLISPAETALLNKLSEAAVDFAALPGRHTDDPEFDRQINRLQDMVLARVGFRSAGAQA
jgi:hypothetical protein